MILLLGKPLAQRVVKQIQQEIKKNDFHPCLSVILIGDDKASKKYIAIKKRECEAIGIKFELFKFNETESQKNIISKITTLNRDKNTTGIIVQLPLPNNLVPNEILEAIDPKKDVDGLTSQNFGKLVKDLPGIYPATAEGVIKLLEYYNIPVQSKRVVVIGQSNLVGKPLAQLLLNKKATVTVANSLTKDLKNITLESDIVISAVGSPGLVTRDMIKKGAVVVDIGTTVKNGKIYGDVDFKEVSKVASAITPNPAGVGPMTVAMLLSNILKAYNERK